MKTIGVPNVHVNKHNTRFKLDSGAKVTVISECEPWLSDVKLEKSGEILYGPGGTKLPVVGTFKASLAYKTKKMEETIYILKDQKSSLLSRDACRKLNLIARVDEVNTSRKPQSPDFKAEFPKLFKGLGMLKKEQHITLRPNATPLCLHAPRKVPHPLLPKVKEEIDRMLRQGVISPIDDPTEWCSGIVTVPKPNGSYRLCVDLSVLNENVLREIHPMATVDESLAKLKGSKIFTKLDAKSGFWQVPLDAESKLLTCFICPFGRFVFNRVPFGISSGPEIFQRAMSKILEGIDGVICHVDDILIHSASQQEHDKRVREVLKRLQDAGLTLNEKCEFSKSQISFLGHLVDGEGIHADTRKTNGVSDFPTPTNVTELQRFMGMVNQLGKFIPNLQDYTGPLRELLRSDTSWQWEESQRRSFQKVKDLLVSPQVLVPYDPNRPTIIAADASNTGIGAVLMQVQDDGKRRPVCYASRSLKDHELRYAVIEKEALAATWACEKFEEYVLGLQFTIETDHKPLVPLLTNKELAKLPPRIQRFRLKMMRYAPKVIHVPGKQQIIADALSRAPSSEPNDADIALIAEVEAYASHVVNALPATQQRLQTITNAQQADEECRQIIDYCQHGWPAYMPSLPLLRQYWENRSHLAVVDNLLLYDERIVIPRSMRLEILDCIHQGHLGITKCRARARNAVWWPGLSQSIEELVTKCHQCAINRPEHKEPLLPSSFPERPWERIGTDLFQFKNAMYLIVTDYYSRWIEIKKLKDQTSLAVIAVLKELFAQHGIPDLVVSDNGPQYSSEQFSKFAATYGFVHTTSSPHYPQANGEAERAVRTVKALLKKNSDPYLALLTYRSTPLQNGQSPSELLMGRRLRTQLPVLPATLQPGSRNKDLQKVREKEEVYRANQERNFNNRHRAKDKAVLQPGDQVWLKDQNRYGQILKRTSEPRSYLVKTPQGQVRRNRSALVSVQPDKDIVDPPKELSTKDNVAKQQETTSVPPSSIIQPAMKPPEPTVQKTTRSGRVVKPNSKYKDYVK